MAAWVLLHRPQKESRVRLSPTCNLPGGGLKLANKQVVLEGRANPGMWHKKNGGFSLSSEPT